MRLLERVAIVVVSLALAVAVIVVLSGGPLTGRDNPGISGATSRLGVGFRDLGDARLAAGSPRPHYDSTPPTSGPHVPVGVRHDESKLSDNQLLGALARGDVVVMYGTRKPPAQLRRLAASIAAPFTPALAAAGQAVILAHRPGLSGLLALAWTRLLHVRTISDPQLRSFMLLWLGRGAAHHN
jgi:Protein of unknown function (DUF3105)